MFCRTGFVSLLLLLGADEGRTRDGGRRIVIGVIVDAVVVVVIISVGDDGGGTDGRPLLDDVSVWCDRAAERAL